MQNDLKLSYELVRGRERANRLLRRVSAELHSMTVELTAEVIIACCTAFTLNNCIYHHRFVIVCLVV